MLMEKRVKVEKESRRKVMPNKCNTPKGKPLFLVPSNDEEEAMEILDVVLMVSVPKEAKDEVPRGRRRKENFIPLPPTDGIHCPLKEVHKKFERYAPSYQARQ